MKCVTFFALKGNVLLRFCKITKITFCDQIFRAIWTSKNHYFVRFLRFQTRPPTKNSPSNFATRPGGNHYRQARFPLKPLYKRTDLRTNSQEGSREGPGGGVLKRDPFGSLWIPLDSGFHLKRCCSIRF